MESVYSGMGQHFTKTELNFSTDSKGYFAALTSCTVEQTDICIIEIGIDLASFK